MSRKQIVILGGGTGGTMTANRLRRRFDPDEAEIHVVDRDDRHVYQPGLLFVPFGLAHVDEIVRPRRRQLRNGVVFHENEVEEVWADRDEVLLDDGTVLPLRRARGRHRRAPAAGGDRRPDRCRLERACLHLLRPARRRGAATCARALRRRPPGREPGRHADQVPGRAARVRLPRRLAPARARNPQPHRARLRDTARRRLHQADRLRASGRPARREGDRAGDRVQRRRGRRRRRHAHVLRRPRARLRPARHGSAARRRPLRRALTRARRRARLRPHRQAHAADAGQAERVRARRRHRSAHLEGRLRHALRGRGA